MEQRQVPPIVDFQETVLRPGFRIGAHPGDAVSLPALHFHDVCHRVLRPAIARLDLDRLPAEAFGPRIVAHLLQPEGLHAQNGVVARHAPLPRRQGPADAVAQHAGIAGEEIDLVSHLQRQRVERVVDRDVLKDAGGVMPAALCQMAERGDMRLLARAGGKRQRRGVA